MSLAEENYVTQLEETPKQVARPMESQELNKLFEALSKAQLEMDVAKTDSTNPYFKSKYADLRSVVDASRPFLSKNGLCVIQRTIPEKNGNSYLYTRLGHLSGQWVESVMPINPPKQDIQTLGSYLTYLRRYSYSSMVGVVAGEEDDDGEVAMNKSRSAPAQKKASLSQTQLKKLGDAIDNDQYLLDSIFNEYKISKLYELPLEKYERCLMRIEKYKDQIGDKKE